MKEETMAGVTRATPRIPQPPVAHPAPKAVIAAAEKAKEASQSSLNGRVASWSHRIFDFKDRILRNISSAVSTVFSGVREFAGAIRSNARPISIGLVGMGVGAILMVALGILRKNATTPPKPPKGDDSVPLRDSEKPGEREDISSQPSVRSGRSSSSSPPQEGDDIQIPTDGAPAAAGNQQDTEPQSQE